MGHPGLRLAPGCCPLLRSASSAQGGVCGRDLGGVRGWAGAGASTAWEGGALAVVVLGWSWGSPAVGGTVQLPQPQESGSLEQAQLGWGGRAVPAAVQHPAALVL